ncbi:MAG: transposase [Candidatus Eisenbacteria bacterium]|nr:transposase [Candidatus Eisenbacteria bacterium]
MAKQKRKQYTQQQRDQILAAAKSQKLTAKQVQKKFGVTMVTYYLWRRKAGLTRTRGMGRVAMGKLGPSQSGLTQLVRQTVRERIQRELPTIVRDEVQSYLNKLLAKAPGHGTRRA